MTSVESVSPLRRRLIAILVPIYLVAVPAVALLLAALPVLTAPSMTLRMVALAAAPVIFGVVYPVTAAVLSLPWQGGIKPGLFPRDTGHSVYGKRRMYGLCWTAVYYCTPVYYAVLTVPLLRRLVFRLFGYRGALDITLYPDTWIRDLPLLEVEPGAYLSNRSTIGTNICLSGNRILCRPIRIGADSIVGHWVLIGCGVTIGKGAEVGIGTRLGAHAEIGPNAHISPCGVIYHRARIGEKTKIGVGAMIGAKAVVGPNLRIQDFSVIPEGTRVLTQSDADRHAPIQGRTGYVEAPPQAMEYSRSLFPDEDLQQLGT